jgi:hypothetical protein
LFGNHKATLLLYLRLVQFAPKWRRLPRKWPCSLAFWWICPSGELGPITTMALRVSLSLSLSLSPPTPLNFQFPLFFFFPN